MIHIRHVNKKSNVTNKQKKRLTLDILPFILCPASRSSETIYSPTEGTVFTLYACAKTKHNKTVNKRIILHLISSPNY